MIIRAHLEFWPLEKPFRISTAEYTTTEVLVVEIETDGNIGRGEAAGVDYHGETPAGLLEDALAFIRSAPKALTQADLGRMLGPGGLRNALDCALWDLEAKTRGRRAWEVAELAAPTTMKTFFTLSMDSPAAMAAEAAALPFNNLKLKLGDEIDMDRLRAVRETRCDANIIVDANCAWTIDRLDALMPELQDIGVQMIEQPLDPAADDALRDFDSPIILCADESCQTSADLPSLRSKYDMVNIKLDKTGGLTEALLLLNQAKDLGMRVMVGCMSATSLGIAPALLVATDAEIVDLDWHLLNAYDRPYGFPRDGQLSPPPAALWG